jgi:transcriptional regulator with XRE-family HTH domain
MTVPVAHTDKSSIFPILNQRLGKNLRQLRLAAGLSQQEVATPLGVTFQQVQKYEAGTTRLSAPQCWYLAQLFGVPVRTFFTGFEEATAKGKEDCSVTSGLLQRWQRFGPVLRELDRIDDVRIEQTLHILLGRVR